jgi:hypothetical protein
MKHYNKPVFNQTECDTFTAYTNIGNLLGRTRLDEVCICCYEREATHVRCCLHKRMEGTFFFGGN